VNSESNQKHDGQQDKHRSHSSRRRRINHSGSVKKEEKTTLESKKEDLRICPLCSKPIFDLAGAFAAREDGQPIHFDCALEQLAKEERLEPDEKLIYVGSGYFAVCAQLAGKLEIRRKIKWESNGTAQEWRKSMMLTPNLP
jgi:hypothetical protein